MLDIDKDVDLNNEQAVRHLQSILIDTSLDSLKYPSTPKSEKEDVTFWVMRPSKVLDANGDVIYDASLDTFSFVACCKSVGLDYEEIQSFLIENDYLTSTEFDMSAYRKFFAKREKQDAKILARELEETQTPNPEVPLIDNEAVFMAAQIDLF